MFAEGGFRSCLLKGHGNAQMYPNPLIRQSGDIDLWVDGGRYEVTRYVTILVGNVITKYKDIAFKYKDATVEVHSFYTYLNNFRYNKRLQWYIEDNREQQFEHRVGIGDGMNICSPTDDFNVIFQRWLIYIIIFYCEGIGMRHYIDYLYL